MTGETGEQSSRMDRLERTLGVVAVDVRAVRDQGSLLTGRVDVLTGRLDDLSGRWDAEFIGIREYFVEQRGYIEFIAARLGRKMDAGFERLDSRIDAGLDQKIDTGLARLDARIDRLEINMTAGFAALGSKIDQVIDLVLQDRRRPS